MNFSRSVFFLNEIKWDTQTLYFSLALALLPQRLLLLILVLGLYDGVSSYLCTQTLDYWKNQTSSPVLLVEYDLILVWLYGYLSVLALYKLCRYLCVSIFIDCSFPVQML